LFGRTNMNPVSRFINEIPEDLLEVLHKEVKQQTSAFSSQQKRPVSRPVSRPIPTGTGADELEWKVGDKAEHKKWGIGTVVSVKGKDKSVELDIAFPSPVGIKRLLAEFAPIQKV